MLIRIGSISQSMREWMQRPATQKKQIEFDKKLKNKKAKDIPLVSFLNLIQTCHNQLSSIC